MLRIKTYCKFCGYALNEAKECKYKDCINYTPDTSDKAVAAPTTATPDGTSATGK